MKALTASGSGAWRWPRCEVLGSYTYIYIDTCIFVCTYMYIDILLLFLSLWFFPVSGLLMCSMQGGCLLSRRFPAAAVATRLENPIVSGSPLGTARKASVSSVATRVSALQRFSSSGAWQF